MLARPSRGAAVLLAVAGLLLLPSAALAAPAPPVVRCEFAADELAEVSGLVVGRDGPAVVNDSGNPSTVYTVGDDCAVTREVAVPQAGTDVEDLGLAGDGTLWVADIGDNRRQRADVAVIRVPASGSGSPPQVTTRLTYADGPHDAETLVVGGDGRPVIVTKDLGGRSGVYTTDRPLPPVTGTGADPLVLRRVGEVALPPTTTPSGSADPAAAFGGGLITGGAMSDDGRLVALRTYTDAWLYPVAGRDADAVVAGLRAAPVQVPLPGEPQGEAVAFAPDGTLLSASESPGEVGPASATSTGALRAVPGAAGLVTASPGTPTPTAPLTPSVPAGPAAAPAEPASDGDDGLSPAAWVGVGIAIAAGVGGSVYAARRGR